jgi:hypothetical protein
MSIFSASFTAVAATAEQDVFEIVAPSDSRVAVRSISLSQYSDAGDASAELLSVVLMRGHTTSGSGGSLATRRFGAPSRVWSALLTSPDLRDRVDRLIVAHLSAGG